MNKTKKETKNEQNQKSQNIMMSSCSLLLVVIIDRHHCWSSSSLLVIIVACCYHWSSLSLFPSLSLLPFGCLARLVAGAGRCCWRGTSHNPPCKQWLVRPDVGAWHWCWPCCRCVIVVAMSPCTLYVPHEQRGLLAAVGGVVVVVVVVVVVPCCQCPGMSVSFC